jgi:hypothetical protein
MLGLLELHTYETTSGFLSTLKQKNYNFKQSIRASLIHHEFLLYGVWMAILKLRPQMMSGQLAFIEDIISH